MNTQIRLMKRRDFNFGLLAAGTAPLVKVPLAAKAAPAAVAANFTPFAYASAAQFARLSGSCSVKLLIERFGMSPDVAQVINRRLIKQGIIGAPNLLGVSEATQKYAPKPFTGEASVKPGSAGPKTPSESARKLLGEDDLEETVLDNERCEEADEAPSQAQA